MTFSTLIQAAVNKAGKQEALAIELDLAPSALSKRINGEVGWHEKEINRILAISGLEITDRSDSAKKIQTLKDTIRILIENE